MRWLLGSVGALCAAVMVRGAPQQDAYDLGQQHAPDFVDVLIDEARMRQIPLDKELRPTDAQRSSRSFAWTPCSDPSAALHIASIELQPDPPEKGKNLTVHGKATLFSEVTNGTFLDLSVHVGFLRIYRQRIDVCEALRENDVAVQCPALPGDYDVAHTALLPAQIPPAKYSVHIEGTTQTGHPLSCLDLTVSFSMFGRLRSWLRS